MNQFIQGTLVTLTGPFKDSSGNLVDPTTVTLKYRLATTSFGQTTTLTYTGASEPAIGVIARIAEGVYVAWIDSTNMAPGVWVQVWTSTGLGQAAGDELFEVLPQAA